MHTYILCLRLYPHTHIRFALFSLLSCFSKTTSKLSVNIPHIFLSLVFFHHSMAFFPQIHSILVRGRIPYLTHDNSKYANGTTQYTYIPLLHILLAPCYIFVSLCGGGVWRRDRAFQNNNMY